MTKTKELKKLSSEQEAELNTGFDMKSSSSAFSKLLSHATPADGSNSRLLEDNGQYNHISKYSIQFQGCNQIKHWNKDADDGDEDAVRVSTKRLVRFRLVPYRKCSAYNPWMDASAIKMARDLIGRADYGDYIVDMDTFLAAYLEMQDEYANMNAGDDDGNGNGDDDGNNNRNRNRDRELYYDDADNDNFDINDYAACAAFDFDINNGDDDNDGDDGNNNNNNGDDDANNNNKQYYVGPYCGNAGSEIRLNLFEDDTCTTITRCNNGATRGADCYTELTGGLTIPYTNRGDSIITDPCIPCSANYKFLSSLEDQNEVGSLDADYDFGYPRDACYNLYDASGKCESHLSTSSGNSQYEYGCEYIKGIEMGLSSDGYAVAVKRSLGADAVMASLAIGCTFMGMCVYYLRHASKKADSDGYKSSFYVNSENLS